MEGENLVEAWERFHELLRRCLHHRLTRWIQVHTFYNGLSDPTRTIIDASTGVSWSKDKVVVRKAVGGVNIDVLSNLVTYVALLTKQLQKQQGAVNAIQTNPWEICESWGGQHSTIECQL